jgi:predicted trehalose synthase
VSDLTDYLVEQRWFASKAREVSHTDVLEEIPLADGLRETFVEAVFQPGTHETYQLLRAPGKPGDVLTERAGVLLDLMRRDADVEGDESVIHFRSVGQLDQGGPPRPMAAEQSNSSVVFGDELVLKVYRRLEPGINPDLELTRFLTEHDFAHVPALEGWYEVEGRALDATLGMLQQFIEGRDGWELALDEIGFEPDRFLARLRPLGQVVGEMHSVLASDPDDPAFAPEEPSQESIGLLTATVDEEIERIFTELGDREATAPIEGRGEEIRDVLRMLTQVAVGGRFIRHHGDLHLGQTLLSGDDWVILDFEGEPARPLVERRRKRSPLRDVAGMLRSFAYVASASEIQRGIPAPEDWEERAREAFLAGYFESVDRTLLPPSEAATQQLLQIFELEKAIYELRYELNNRPDWVKIPVAGVLRLLEATVA